MRVRARGWSTLAGGLLGMSLLIAPMATAATPSAAPGVSPGVTAGASPSASPDASTTPTGSAAPLPSMDPAAYQTLLATIPEPLRSSCEPDTFWQLPDLGPDPGEIAQTDCGPDGSGGTYATFSLFDSAASMGAFYEEQLAGMRALGGLEGPGCPTGPGEGTWEHGRRFCFALFGDDANMRWTHEALAITASAMQDDGDWAALDAFVRSAGPIADS